MAPIAITDDSSTGSPVSETGSFGQPQDSHESNRSRRVANGDNDTNGQGRHSGDSHNGFSDANGHTVTEPIAIVGMACRFPGNVSSPSEFWELLSRTRTGFTAVPERRFDSSAFYHPNPGKGGTFNAVGGNFLDVDLAAFDAPFFGLTEKEAISMDPQQRLLLECTFEALESAGIPKHSIVGKNVGVFVGGSFPEYESHLFRDSDAIPMHQATGCAYAMQSNRISHFFDLRGPSYTVDTACSASMVALHQACQSLRTGESSIALAGGCHLNMLPEFWVSFSTCRLLSDSGRSIAFDDRGTGFGRGEGCGMIVLKPLSQATRDGDTIRAVIAGTGINQDGKTAGITLPNGEAQEALMRHVYEKYGLNPSDCGFVEAHGTGTRVGDPIEATALHNVLGRDRSARDPLFIGSVKSNIGHLEAASGIAAVIKAALMLERGFLLPNYDFKRPNPKIPWKEWNMKVQTMQRPWPKRKRFISVNNFGFGGTNGHAVLEAAPSKRKVDRAGVTKDVEKSQKLFVLTANDKAALTTVQRNIVVYLEQRPEVFQSALMDNVAYSLGQRRSHLSWRATVRADNSFELIEALNGKDIVPGKVGDPLRIGFVFTGQGAQWHAMGRELYSQYPVFASSIDLADRCLAAAGAEWSLIEELSRDAKTSKINEAHLSQPCCTALQLALTDLLSSWNVHPAAVVGHSSGEIGAAYAAGILTFDSAVLIAYHRGRLIPVLKEKFPRLEGRMMAVGGSAEELGPMIEDLEEKEVRIACYNSPSSLTISGDNLALTELERLCTEKQIFNRRLLVETAYHSHHMNLIAKNYRGSILKLDKPVNTSIQFHSSLFGRLVDGIELEPQYWVDNLTNPVRFSEALQSMVEAEGDGQTGVNMLVELGPHPALQGPIKQILKALGGGAAKVPYASALSRKRNAVHTALDLAGTLFTKGALLNFEAINFPKPTTQTPTLLTDLPRYPWNYSNRYWQESRMTEKHKHRKTLRSDILGVEAIYSHDEEPTWRNIIRVDDLPWLQHHKVQSLTVFPMSGFIVMVLEAAVQRAAKKDIAVDSFEITSLNVVKPLVITEEDVELTTQLRPSYEASESCDEFRICSWSSAKGWTQHCIGFVCAKGVDSNTVDPQRQKQAIGTLLQDIKDLSRTTCSQRLDVCQLYRDLYQIGVTYGPTFQGIQVCEASHNAATGSIVIQDIAKEMPNHHLASPLMHPASLEAIIEMYWPILAAASSDTVYLPSSASKIVFSSRVFAPAKEPGTLLKVYCQGSWDVESPKPTKVSMYATNDDNDLEPLITFEDLVVSPILDDQLSTGDADLRELCFKMEWEPALVPLMQTNGTGAIKGNGVPTLATIEVAIIHGTSESQLSIATSLATEIECLTGTTVDIGDLETVNAPGKVLIILTELQHPLLATLSCNQFSALQKCLSSAGGVLWLTRGACGKSTNPDVNMIAGLSRAIRSETASRFSTLDLDAGFHLSETGTVQAIVHVFCAIFSPEASREGELEFMEREGCFFTPRIVKDDATNKYVHKQTNPSAIEPTPFRSEQRKLKLSSLGHGTLDNLYFVDDDVAERPLAADEIEIEVKAVAVNYRDIAAIKTQAKVAPGLEASGVIASVGTTVTNLKPGDRITALTSGAYGHCTRTRAANAFKIPDGLSFEAAASLPLAYCTAYQGLVGGHGQRLLPDETVLVHEAASAVGQAFVALAQADGLCVFATVTRAEDKTMLISEHSVPEDNIFYGGSPSFAKGIRQVTNGQGVDLIVNSSMPTPDLVKESWKCLSKFGRFIDIERRDASSPACFNMPPAELNATFISVDVCSMMESRPKAVERLMAGVGQMLQYGKIRPIAPVSAFPVSDIETVFKKMQTAAPSGKLVIVPQADDIVMATPPKKIRALLKPDATYLLIGGTGGLGRSMARWMVSRGARTIVLVSRSASVTGKVKELSEDMSELGADIIVKKCDVISRADVDNLIASLVDLPPIRGVVHGTMVLKDVLYEEMTFEEYTTVIEGKVQGGWNFHHALENSPLDFFVAISSAAGVVGNSKISYPVLNSQAKNRAMLTSRKGGQAAYAAANCFLNALVQYRLARGLPASSLDLTMVSDSGHLAENAEKLAEVARNLGSDSICEAEVLALLGAAISGRLGETCGNHAITGMRITPTMRPFWTDDAKFKHLRLAMEEAAAADSSANGVATVSFNAALKAAKTQQEAEDVACAGLVSKISAVLMLEAEDMDVQRSLSHYPLDSLVAIEIRNFITREFEANMQVLELLSSGSIQTLARAVCAKSKIVSFS